MAMDSYPGNIPILRDEIIPGNYILSLDELEELEIPYASAAFNTCTRSGQDRRELAERSRRESPGCGERRGCRDRRLLTYL